MARGLVLLIALAALPLRAGDRAGDFDYYLLAVSWSPSWCAAEGDARDAAVCRPGSGRGFTLHGLWPQYEAGWPEYCATEAPDPSPRETAAMADLMGAAALVRYQWQKHGRCSGDAAADYFAAAREAFQALDLPEPAGGRTTAGALEAAFRRLNPGYAADAVIVTCRDGLAMELRLCLTRGLAPRACGGDVLARACRSERALSLPPPR